MSIKVNTGKIKSCIVLGFTRYEIWFNDDYYKVALKNAHIMSEMLLRKSPVMKLTDVLDRAWFRHKNMYNLTSSLDVRRQRSNNNYATNQSYGVFRQSYYDSKNVHESARQREERSIQKLIAEIEEIAK